MGHFSHTCKVSGLDIHDNAVLIVMKMNDNHYDNSEESLRTFGKAYMCSNDGTRLKFSPVWLPIFGKYDTYGRLVDIIEDDNTRIISKYYDLPIDQIIDIVCSSRKDDGHDSCLDPIKNSLVKTENPVYNNRYKELLSYSGMWVNGDFYSKVIKLKDRYQELLLGNIAFLESMGFKLVNTNKDRYKYEMEKDGLKICSDGTWINENGRGIYSLKCLQSYCEKNNVKIDIDKYANLDTVGQILEFVVPNIEEDSGPKFYMSRVNYYLLGGKFDTIMNITGAVKNPMTPIYLESIKNGLLKDQFINFWKFDKCMYSLGRFYDLIGTAPQDSDPCEMMEVFKIMSDVMNHQYKEYKKYSEDGED